MIPFTIATSTTIKPNRRRGIIITSTTPLLNYLGIVIKTIPTLLMLLMLPLLLLIALEDGVGKVSAMDQSIPWVSAGKEAKLPARYATVGDTFTFVFNTGDHDVYIHPRGTCNPEGAIFVGNQGGGATKYTFKEEDVGRMVFACDVGTHCEEGSQLLMVVVSPATTNDDNDSNNNSDATGGNSGGDSNKDDNSSNNKQPSSPYTPSLAPVPRQYPGVSPQTLGQQQTEKGSSSQSIWSIISWLGGAGGARGDAAATAAGGAFLVLVITLTVLLV